MDKKKGVTLVEVMAAFVIFIIILSMVSSFIIFIMRINNKSKDVSLDEELLKQNFIVLNRQIKNHKEIKIEDKKLTIVKDTGEYEIILLSSGSLVRQKVNTNNPEIISNNIKDIKFYRKNSLLYIYIASKGGSEVERVIPI